MVTTKLIGRLGNQLFQMANTIAYAKRHSLPYWIPNQTIDPRVWKIYYTNLPQEPEQFYKYQLYRELGHDYHEIPYMKDVLFEGYWQSEKYFQDERQEILTCFSIPWKPLPGFVSVHVRRGDYLQYADKHPPVTIEYLTDAIMTFRQYGYKSFLVCSDDIKWCKKNLSHLKHEGIAFTYSENRTEIEDLSMMSCCEHNIISNSSFSWWSAWLNMNENKTVIAPKIWFGPGNAHLNIKDLLPEKWITI